MLGTTKYSTSSSKNLKSDLFRVAIVLEVESHARNCKHSDYDTNMLSCFSLWAT